jgi:hypothetical protein
MAMTRRGVGSSALVRLLDALEADLLAAVAAEVRDVLRETGRDPDCACQEIRTVLQTAMRQEDGATIQARHDWPTGIPLHRH